MSHLVQLPLPFSELGLSPTCHCTRCGRRLTDPASVARGMGDICAAKSNEQEHGSNRPTDQHDPAFTCRGWHSSQDGICDVQVFHHDDKTVVVVSELIDTNGDYANPGISVTNSIERIASDVVNELGVTFDTLIEFYPVRLKGVRQQQRGRRIDPIYDETFALVQFGDRRGDQFVSPTWTHITRACAEELIGQLFTYDYVSKA